MPSEYNNRIQPEPLLNDAEAAAFLGGLHPKTVQRMARQGEIPHYRVKRYYRYRASELNDWLCGKFTPPDKTRLPQLERRQHEA